MQNEKVVVLKDSVFKSAELSKKWTSAVQGGWNSEMICSSSDCGLYTVGDRRNEKWEFIQDTVKVYSTGMMKKKLLTVFNAIYAGDTIILESSNNCPVENGLKIKVQLDNINVNVIKGSQMITGEDDCGSVFSIELTR